MTTDAETAVETEQDETVEVEGKPRMGKKTAIDASRGIGGGVFALDPEIPKIVGLDTSHKQGEHRFWQRRAFLPVDEALVQYMVKHRKSPGIISVQRDGPDVLVHYGRQRVKAGREANRRLIAMGETPIKLLCQIVRGSDLELIGSMISENALGVNYDDIDKAHDLQRYINAGATDEDAALSIGRTVAHTRQLLRLQDVSPKVQDAVRKGLAASAAIKLADLTREEQERELIKIEAGEYKPTVKAIEGAVKAIRKGETSATLAPAKGLLKKIAAHEDAERVLGEDGLLALKWILGLTKPRTIAGLSDLIRKVSE